MRWRRASRPAIIGGGVERGVDDIITVLTTDASEWQKRPDLRLDHRDSATDSLTPWIVLALFVFIVILLTRRAARRRQRRLFLGLFDRGSALGQRRSAAEAPAERDYFWSNLLSFILGMLANSGGRGGGWGDGGGFGGGGGFSGGGGSSGGGGASGSW